MKQIKTIISTFAFLLFAVCAFSQTNAQKAADLTQSLDKAVNLNATQEASITQINMTFLTARAEANNNVAVIRTLKTERQEAIDKVLTVSQKAILAKPIRAAGK